MNISARPYQAEADLYKIQTATAEWVATAGFRGYLNASDIALRLFNGMRRYNPVEIVRLWEADTGRLLGWSMICPPWNSYEVLLHPDYRGKDLEIEILDWAEREIINWLHKEGRENQPIQLDVFDGDTPRMTLLEERGYSRQERGDVVETRSLDVPIPPPQLPEGFSIRGLEGEHEVANSVALINDSFGWTWTVENYLKVLRSPGCSIDNERVVVAPDGRFAASCILLSDAHNRSVMFENVGTSGDFRRLGLAKALLYDGMHHMKAAGFTLAMVPHSAEQVASALYASVGFQPTYKIDHYIMDANRRSTPAF